MRLATRGADKIEDCEWVSHTIPIIGLLAVAGAPTDIVKPCEGEDLFRYMDRLFPYFLEALEEIWGPINVPSADDVLRLAARASALEARLREVEDEAWIAQGMPIEVRNDTS